MVLLNLLAGILLSPVAGAYPEDLDLSGAAREPAASTVASPDGSAPAPAQKQAEEHLAEEQARQAEVKKIEDAQKPQIEAELKAAARHERREFDTNLCSSAREYIETLKFLRETKVIILPESTARLIADKVSKACDGGAARFAQVLTLLKTVGLSDLKALEVALDFSARAPDVQKNFLSIFSKAFLAEFFDYDYKTAVALAFELSKDYHGDPNQVRDDFIELVRFCKEDDKLDLPNRLCAEYTIKLAKLTQYHPDGLRGSFYKLFARLRDDRTFSMDIRNALELSYNILRFGPRAADNFFLAYDYAVSEQGLKMAHAAGLEFGLRLAARSFRGATPPLAPNPAAPMMMMKPEVVMRNAASVR